MKTRIVIYTALVVGLVAVYLVVWGPKFHKLQTPVIPPQGSIDNSAANVGQTNMATPTTSSSGEWERPAGVDKAGWKYMLTVRDMMLQSNQSVEFHARVIDQSGLPVADAKLELRLTYVDEAKVKSPTFIRMKMGSEIASRPIELRSDNQGWLHLSGIKGKILDITGLSKDGYLSNMPEGNYDSLIFDPNGKRRTSVRLEMMDALNSSKGYTFHLWKKGETEKLIKWSKSIRLPRDIPQHKVNLFGLDNQEATADIIIESELVHPELPISDEYPRAFDRWIRIRPVNGEIQLTQDVYPYLVTDQGKYEPQFQFLYQVNNRESEGWQKNFYVKARNGRCYASLQVRFVQMPMSLQIETLVNPTGSRNLEPDPEKLITDLEEIRHLDDQTRVIK